MDKVADNGRGQMLAYLVASGLLGSKAKEAKDGKGRTCALE